MIYYLQLRRRLECWPSPCRCGGLHTVCKVQMPTKSVSFVYAPSCFPSLTARRKQSTRHTVCAVAPSQTRPSMKQIRGVSEIADRYDAVLLDQFGVIHDGQTPYPRALEAIRKLAEHGLKIVVLSNSSKQADRATKKLSKMGVEPRHIHGVVTSGQLAMAAMRKLMVQTPKARVLHFNWTAARGTISLLDHNITEIAPFTSTLGSSKVPAPESIDFILAHGTDAITSSHDEVQPTPLPVLRDLCVQLAHARPELPFYCCNPDIVTVDGPQLRVMPGTLAKDFEDAGGQHVHRLGKPAAVAYDAAMDLLEMTDKGRVLAIGDSFAHDILGGANAGIDSL